MPTLSNPSEIARETLRQLAVRRVPPTPENYRTLYHEIAGTQPSGAPFPEKQLRALASALPKSSAEQSRLARQLDEALKNQNWDAFQTHLAEFIKGLAEAQRLSWGELIGDLLRQWEAKQAGITPARKREALDHVLASAGSNPETLFARLQGMVRGWAQAPDAGQPDSPPSDEPATLAAAPAASARRAGPLSQASELLPELRELFAYTLETAIATQLLEAPQLSADAGSLANDIRNAVRVDQLQDFLGRLKRFAFKLELLAEDQAELRRSLLGLLRLMVENVSELVMDDRWLHGQIEVVRDIIGKPLSQRAIDDAQRRFKEVVYKQSQLKQSLHEAQAAIKHMLAGFVDHLVVFGDATADYHDKIEAFAKRISGADNITELEKVIDEVVRETRGIQLSAARSRDDLRVTQARVRESEARIRELEKELAQASEQLRHDQLTGSLNRRGLEEVCVQEIARAKRRENPLCMSILDIDNFKRLNDALGHRAGDQALIHLAAVCRESLRQQDTLARYGGEEFVILMPDTDLEEASLVLNRLQRELTRRFFLHNNQKVLITFSAGVTQLKPSDTSADIFKRADEAMYQAKTTGKNKVITA